MRSYKSIVLIGLMIFFANGCSAESDRKAPFQNANEVPSSHFRSNLSRATAFWELYEDGLKQYESGNYNQALELYKRALKEYSASKPTQAAAMNQIAIVYEAMNNDTEAIKFYELSAETTMSEKDRKRLTDIAQALRHKSDHIEP